MGYAAGQFLNSMVDMANRPADLSVRQVVLSQAQEAAQRFAAAGVQLDTVQTSVNEELKVSAAQINQLTSGIAKVNGQIASLKGLSAAPNDLLDERDRLVGRLNDLVQTTGIVADDGSLTVFIAGGQPLVLGNRANSVSIVADEADASRSALSINNAGTAAVIGPEYLSGGSVAGLLNFQNKDLVAARNDLGQLAAGLVWAVNKQQSLGLDLGNPPLAGTDLFKPTQPVVRNALTNVRDAQGGFAANVSLNITDASQLVASDYDLRQDDAGNWNLTRLSDGLERQVKDGDILDGFQLDLGTPPPAAKDRFLLQPVGQAAKDMKVELKDPAGLAAASPLTATVGATNLGTASVGSLRVVSPIPRPVGSLQITFTSDTGNYQLQALAADGSAVGPAVAGVWKPGSPIATPDFELNLDGVPANGDTFSVSPTQFPKANNGNALALVALRDQQMVGRTVMDDGTSSGGLTVTDAYAGSMARIGSSVQRATSASDISSAVSKQAETARASSSGVNLDEEAARLLQFQQSYQASAKVLQIAQSLFDSVLQAASR